LPQGLKPGAFPAGIGTTKVVPFRGGFQEGFVIYTDRAGLVLRAFLLHHNDFERSRPAIVLAQ
jgi:hypothetical protein